MLIDSFNKCDRELSAHGVIGDVHDYKGSQAVKNKHSITSARPRMNSNKQSSNKDPQSATTKADKWQGNCFNCHKAGHRMRNCPVMKKPEVNSLKAAFTNHPANDPDDKDQMTSTKAMSKNKPLKVRAKTIKGYPRVST